MASERLIATDGPGYSQMESEPLVPSTSSLIIGHQNEAELTWIFDELPKGSIVRVSRPDASDISPMLLSYTIELQYKQVTTANFDLNECNCARVTGLLGVYFCLFGLSC